MTEQLAIRSARDSSDAALGERPGLTFEQRVLLAPMSAIPGVLELAVSVPLVRSDAVQVSECC